MRPYPYGGEVLRCAARARPTAADPSSYVSSTRRACGSSSVPVGVSTTPCRSRRNSSARIYLLRVGWETCRRSAARVKCSSSATARE